jgi:hypothetical protein
MIKAIAKATFVAGTLDILSAFVFAGMAGMGPVAILQYVASGPFGEQAKFGAGWAVVGLLVHYAIMACMAATFIFAAKRLSLLTRRPIVSGIAYGFILWIIMYWIIKPMRWPDAPLPHTAWGIGNALFSHCILVGIPIAWITARRFNRA